MDPSQPNSTQTESTDVFSLTDQDLADKLQFVEEIGFGNWGSVWLCRPKISPDASDEGLAQNRGQKIAVKLVHRSKTTTTAARVRSLWNEMKIVRTFKADPHPSIIPFHSFIITPSYALITMTYLPILIPVEIDEARARLWFRLLLSAVEFLHERGVVHNDIKPANILLNEKSVPVLVDFGFAGKYDPKSSTAFHSNLSYGTPEYLAPERARGLPHDTRKSDVWSLGVTFFEILVGRTPFEYSDNEQFTTKEDLEQYWARTLRGKWVGTWKMSQSMECLLRCMVAPNADLRCTAKDAMANDYWHQRPVINTHRRSTSCHSSYELTKEVMPTTPKKGQEIPNTPSSLDNSTENLRIHTLRHGLTRSRSQSKLGVATKVQTRKRVVATPPMDLSPIKASPPVTPTGKENASMVVLNSSGRKNRKPFGDVNNLENVPQPQFVKPADEAQAKRRSRVLGDRTAHYENINKGRRMKETPNKAKVNHAKDRVREWEREKERLREMARLEELEKEQEELEVQVIQQETEVEQEIEQERSSTSPVTSPSPQNSSVPSSVAVSTCAVTPRRTSSPGLSHLKHSIKKSIDKTVQFYKSSTFGRNTPRTTSFDLLDDAPRAEPPDERMSWEDDAFVQEADSSLPAIRQALHNERVGADARTDRMTIWMQNVEKVVEDARQTFALSAPQPTALPPLPVAPLSRRPSNQRSHGRLPRKILAASQIFTEDSMDVSNSMTANTSTFDQSKNEASQDASQILSNVETPARKRRATVSTRSPEPVVSPSTACSHLKQNSGLAEKLQLHIATLSQLEAELNKPPKPEPSPRLSQFMDRSLFIQTPLSRKPSIDPDPEEEETRPSTDDDLASSPLHVEPYPSRKPSSQSTNISAPEQRRLESVYDRFLMATTGVKRVGKGYQSDNLSPVANNTQPPHQETHNRRNAMPPPVSSEDSETRPTMVVDELGVMTYSQPGTGTPVVKDGSNTTVALVRRAIKAIVPVKTVSRKLSRAMA